MKPPLSKDGKMKSPFQKGDNEDVIARPPVVTTLNVIRPQEFPRLFCFEMNKRNVLERVQGGEGEAFRRPVFFSHDLAELGDDVRILSGHVP